jgi:hypothetical protein
MLTLFKLFASIFIITLVSLISLHQPTLDLCLEMTGLQFLSIQNPSIHFQVNPAIENYVRRLPNKTDHFVLIFMETFAEASDSPIVDGLVGIFIEAHTKSIDAKWAF